MTLWNSFKIDFPEDRINKIQLNELVAQLFPKCNAEVVIENLFKVFGTQVVPTELLMAFSMSMKGSVEQKLYWTFKLYDKVSPCLLLVYSCVKMILRMEAARLIRKKWKRFSRNFAR